MIRTVMPGYFRAMGIPLVSGRVFTDADNVESTPYRFVINQAFATQYLAGEQVLGTQISAAHAKDRSVRRNHRRHGRRARRLGGPGGEAHHLLHTGPHAVHLDGFRAAHLGRPLSLAEPARRAIQGLDAQLAVADIDTMDRIVRETFARQRFSAFLLTGFRGWRCCWRASASTACWPIR